MEQPTPPPPPMATPRQPLDRDVACARCGYNLRGLLPDHFCPECGTPIERSLQGNVLRFADPEWLEKLRFGIALKLWMLLIAVVLGVAGEVARAVGFGAIQVVLGLIAGVLGLWALWLITAPEPNIATAEDPMSLRRFLRVCAVIGFFGEQMESFIKALPAMASGTFPASVWLILTGAMMLIGVVAMAGEFVYLRRFARRIPDDKLADNTTVVMWGFCGTMVLMVILGAVALTVSMGRMAAAGTGAANAPQPPTWAVGVMGLLGCGVLIGFLVFGIWNIVLLFQYHGALQNAIADARRLEQYKSAAAEENVERRMSNSE